MNDLNSLRANLDAIDAHIVSLLDDRMRIVDMIAQVKQSQYLNITDPVREEEVLKHAIASTQHPVLSEHIAIIFRKILEVSRTDQHFSQVRTFPFRRVGIIGLGMMGGSICKGIKLKDPSIHLSTLSLNNEDFSQEINAGWIDQEASSLKALIYKSDLIILASPISTIVPIAQEIHRLHTGHPLTIIDIGSVKSQIVNAFEELTKENLQYVGTHPMAGKETQGFVNSQATLFTGYPWIITPHVHTNKEELRKVIEIVKFFGADPIILTASTHDQQAALISHLPGILSKAFLDFVTRLDPQSLKIAGPGFLSFTRLAHDNPTMRQEIEIHNQTPIQQLLHQWIEHLRELCTI